MYFPLNLEIKYIYLEDFICFASVFLFLKPFREVQMSNFPNRFCYPVMIVHIAFNINAFCFIVICIIIIVNGENNARICG